MVTDHDLVRLVQAAYVRAPTVRAGDVSASITELEGLLVIALPGTREDCVADWFRDTAVR